MFNYTIVRQVKDSNRLEVRCLDCQQYIWPLPSKLVEMDRCPLCYIFNG